MKHHQRGGFMKTTGTRWYGLQLLSFELRLNFMRMRFTTFDVTNNSQGLNCIQFLRKHSQ